MSLSIDHQAVLALLKLLESKGELVGAFEDIPIEVYHHPECPGISSTTLKTVLKRSYAHLGHSKFDTKEMSFGRLFHSFISEPHLIESAKSKDVLLAHKMYANMMRHPIISSLMNGAQHEVTFFSKDEETGLLKKCRADGYNQGIVFDVKTTQDASLGSFVNDCKRYNYRSQAAYYLEVISEAMGFRHEDFRFIASEKEDPCESAIYRTHARSIEEASQEIRIALNKIKEAIDGGVSTWKGYSLNDTEILI